MESEKEWFEAWFDTSYYHTLYSHRNYEEAEQFIHNLCNHLELPMGSTILDFACGKGRHAYFLNRLGYDVLGVDLSFNSIAAAKKMQKEGLRFAVSDIREVIPGEQFDAIFNLFTSFGYFNSLEENLKVMKAIHRMLEPDGVFVIDFMNAKKVIDNLVKAETVHRSKLSFDITRRHENGQIIKTIDFTDQGQDFHFEEKVQTIFLDDFKDLIRESDLQLLETFGDYDLNAFHEDTSDRLILIGKK
ncbi:class I SAM-dependent methyltransferase [Parvicella tangerina]|nr:class I SAM-dependent methyltransferase [Parvicella tangerina]